MQDVLHKVYNTFNRVELYACEVGANSTSLLHHHYITGDAKLC